ncbi:MAG: hypothetical protein M3P18_21985 [Actinomycetota bacterium]|nr:hypothetical protein [Actinomycetota bacterium]
MFRFLLMLEIQPNDPGAFVTAVPNWTVGETLMTGRGQQWRVLVIQTEINEELVDAGVNGIWWSNPARS